MTLDSATTVVRRAGESAGRTLEVLDPLDTLELLHACRRRLEELGGDTLTVDVRAKYAAPGEVSVSRVNLLEAVESLADPEDELTALRVAHALARFAGAADVAIGLERRILREEQNGDAPAPPAASPPQGSQTAPARSSSSPPPGTLAPWRSDRSPRARANNRELVLAAFRDRRGLWLAPREVGAILGVHAERVAPLLRVLLAEDELEHNGELRTKARYRVPPDPADRRQDRAELDRPLDDGVLSRDEAEAEVRRQDTPRDASGAASETADRLDRAPPAPSAVEIGTDAEGRTTMRLRDPAVIAQERARANNERREAADRRRAEREADLRLRTPAEGDAGTILGRVLQSLHYQDGTIPETAARLKLDRADVAAAIRSLEDDGDVTRNGRRRGEIIYRGHA